MLEKSGGPIELHVIDVLSLQIDVSSVMISVGVIWLILSRFIIPRVIKRASGHRITQIQCIGTSSHDLDCVSFSYRKAQFIDPRAALPLD